MADSATDWRTIPDWPGYVINSDPTALQVWSMPRPVPAKGGSVRLIKGKALKPTNDGRVILSRNGKAQVLHMARYLYPLTYPDLIAAERRDREGQAFCRRGHPLMPADHSLLKQWFLYDERHHLADVDPRVSYWGTCNRVCLWCWPDAGDYDECNYSPEWGSGQYPDSQPSSLPATPRPSSHDYDVDEDGQLLLNRHGLFTLSKDIHVSKPTVLRIDGYDLIHAHDDDVIVIRLLSDRGLIDVPMRPHHAHALGLALTDF